jgi:hypothetical protein
VANQAELETISGVTYFRGAWTVENLAPLEASLRASRSTSGARFDASGVTELDTSGGWLLLRFVRASRADSAAPIEGLSDTHAALLELIRGEGELSVPDPERRESFLERTGRATVTGLAASAERSYAHVHGHGHGRQGHPHGDDRPEHGHGNADARCRR